ncbi:MAG: hypothetical protein AABZ47_01950 [Planctomycetota bacterium]
MDRTNLWTRMGHWFKPGTKFSRIMGSADAGLPVMSSDSNQTGVLTDDHKGNGANGFSLRRLRGKQELQRLADGYARVTTLVETLQNHLDAQNVRSQAMVESLDHLASSLSHLPDVSRTQLELLSAIREGLDAHANRAKNLEESLGQLPQLADAQRETMVSISRQLDLGRQTNESVSESMNEFQQAVSRLSEATATSAAAVQQMRGDTAHREARMIDLLEKQTKRFSHLAMFASAVAVLVAAVGLAAALLR